MVDIQESAIPIPAGGTPASDASRPRRSSAQVGLALIVFVSLVVVSYRLIRAPIHGVHQASDCARVYAAAHTAEERLSADNVSYQDPAHPGVDMRCGMVRLRAQYR